MSVYKSTSDVREAMPTSSYRLWCDVWDIWVMCYVCVSPPGEQPLCLRLLARTQLLVFAARLVFYVTYDAVVLHVNTSRLVLTGRLIGALSVTPRAPVCL